MNLFFYPDDLDFKFHVFPSRQDRKTNSFRLFLKEVITISRLDNFVSRSTDLYRPDLINFQTFRQQCMADQPRYIGRGAERDFGRTVNPISTRKGRLCQTHLPPNFETIRHPCYLHMSIKLARQKADKPCNLHSAQLWTGPFSCKNIN